MATSIKAASARVVATTKAARGLTTAATVSNTHLPNPFVTPVSEFLCHRVPVITFPSMPSLKGPSEGRTCKQAPLPSLTRTASSKVGFSGRHLSYGGTVSKRQASQGKISVLLQGVVAASLSCYAYGLGNLLMQDRCTNSGSRGHYQTFVALPHIPIIASKSPCGLFL